MRFEKTIICAFALAFSLFAIPAWSADYHVYGGVYAADPLPEGATPPPSILPSFLTDDEIVGEENFYVTGLLSMVRVDLIDDATDSVLASTVGLLGPYYASFSTSASTTQIRFALYDAATGDKFYETGAVEVASGSNRRYLLVPVSVAEVGGATLIPHPVGTAAYVFTRIGLVEAADIGSDGLADYASAAAHWRNAPFARTLNVFGAASIQYYPLAGAGQYCYKVKATPPSGPAFYINDPLYKRQYVVDTSVSPPTVTSTREKVGPFDEPGVGACYRFTPMSSAPLGGSTVFWSFPDLLAHWNTLNTSNGAHELELEVYRRSTGANQGVAGLSLDVHVDNRAVALSFDAVRQQGAGSLVDLMANPCAIVDLTTGKELFIEFTAHHPGGFLSHYSLTARRNLGPVFTFDSGAYNPATMPGGFSGGTGLTVTKTNADMGITCAYILHLHAWGRATNGYGRLFHPHRSLAYYFQTGS